MTTPETKYDFANGVQWTFGPSGADKLFTMTSLVTGAGRHSEIQDTGTTRSRELYYYAKTKVASLSDENSAMWLAMFWGNDLAAMDQALADADAAHSMNLIPALHQLNPIRTIGTAASTVSLTCSGVRKVPCQYFGLFVWNTFGVNTSAVDADHQVIVSTVPIIHPSV